MNSAPASDKVRNINRAARRLRAFPAVLLCVGFVATPVLSHGAELKQETLRTWDTYVQVANARLDSGQSRWFPVNSESEDRQRLRSGEILISQVGQKNPKPVPSGLIHDWIGTAFMPNATLDGVLSALRNYNAYQDFYKPTVIASKLLANDPACDTYSLRVVNKETVVHTALDMKYQTCYFRVDEHRWYSVTRTTEVREIRHWGTDSEEELPPDEGSGFVWRLYSIARFEEKDGGVYVQVEAIALSRDIPIALRWMVDPIVRRVSRNSLFLSLQETGEAVRSTMAANKVRTRALAEAGGPRSITTSARASADGVLVTPSGHQ